ncbi:GAF domain-containing sensor histidine kinase [Rhodanobacter sp. C01]|uniref:GAF domain-containing sensor histidine kinase n=1 Tax=Rhodanobacter sp. C01 TaxID=1945856 RepID=UPI000984E589|nr:GAF domain-containing sensor histidine kinase [Rhodanobacter sp. C01]OOG49151.1 histidine kinase [Rhodanobacter sp. C01]
MRPIANDVEAIARIGSVPTILQVVAHTTGMRFAAIARVTDTKWTACAVHDQIDFGLKAGGELALESTICNEIRQHHEPVIFGEASSDPRFSRHPVPKMYGFESYVSIPIFRVDGEFFGTLCALDPLPAKLDDPNVVKTLELFAKLIAAELESEERHERSTSALLDAQQAAKLREQFIAVLGHDLRSPLSAIRVGADILQVDPDSRRQRVARHIQRSCDRMAEMIENILDFARGRLGGGIPIALQPAANLAVELGHVVAEVQESHPRRDIRVAMAIDHPVTADAGRIAQLLANLLNNAVVHGAMDKPVVVKVMSDGKHFELSVANGGSPIPPGKIGQLFQPFNRGAEETPQPGLGLGLYIAAEVAKAHHGTLGVSSTAEDGTCFVFRMPISQIPINEA